MAGCGKSSLGMAISEKYDLSFIESSDLDSFIDSYLDALYTPFSIILAYEVYELIRAIPESFSNSILSKILKSSTDSNYVLLNPNP